MTAGAEYLRGLVREFLAAERALARADDEGTDDAALRYLVALHRTQRFIRRAIAHRPAELPRDEA